MKMNRMNAFVTVALLLCVGFASMFAVSADLDADRVLNEGSVSGNGISVEYVDSATEGFGLMTVTFDSDKYGKTFSVQIDGVSSTVMAIPFDLTETFITPQLDVRTHALIVSTDNKNIWNLSLAVKVPIAVEGVTLDSDSKVIEKRESFKLTATIVPGDAKDKAVSWSSSDDSIAVVDEDGNVTGANVGEDVITVTTHDGSKTATCSVTVIAPKVVSVELDKTSVEIGLKQTLILHATVLPEDAGNQSVIWSTSNAKVVSVDKNGKIMGVSGGTAVIKAVSSENTEVFDECTVTVNDTAVKSVSLDKTKMTMTVGDEYQLVATVLPADAFDKRVTWSSSKPAVATVDEDGNVVALSKGSASITVKTLDGKKTAKCTVTVVPVAVESVVIDEVSPVGIPLNETRTLSYTIYPENAGDKTVTWTSSNKKVASVDKDGLIKGLSEGTSVITVTTKDGKFTDKCTVNVSFVGLDSIDLDRSELELIVGDKYTFEVTFNPEDASYKNLTWTTTNKAIASVDKNGTVSAVKAGEVTIVATATNGESAACAVTVKNVPVTGIFLDKTEITMDAGKTATLKATVLPSKAFNKNVSWDSSNPAVASVDQKGKVTALSYGKTTITVTTEDGGYTAECSLTVLDVPIKSVKLPKTLVILTGETQQLVPTINPAIKPTVEWESSDSDIASVDEFGNVTGGGEPGKAIITVKVSNTRTVVPLTAQCTVSVEGIPVKSVTIGESAKTVYNGDEFNLVATVSPEDAYNKEVIWASSKPAVATVDQNGHVTAISKGTANITATAADGSKKTAKCVVTVIPVPVDGVEIDEVSPVNLPLNGTCTLDYTVYPLNAADKTVNWTSSNKKVASVDKNGIIKGLSEGDAVITVTTKDGKHTDSCTVHVLIVELNEITVESELTVMVKQKLTLTPTFDPVEASYKDVVWSVDDKSIATVDKSGNVTGVKAGTTTVTVTSKNYPTISATCEVTVIPAKIIEITLSKDYVVLDINKTATLKATFQMSNADNKNLIWEVVDDEIATVDQKGKITALAEGKTTVRVTSQESYDSEDPVFDECTVYVKTVSVKSVTLDVTKLAMKVDGEYTLKATVGPENATWKDVIWSSSDSSVVSVDEEGNLTAHKAGTAKITVLTLDGNKKVTCTVTVS